MKVSDEELQGLEAEPDTGFGVTIPHERLRRMLQDLRKLQSIKDTVPLVTEALYEVIEESRLITERGHHHKGLVEKRIPALVKAWSDLVRNAKAKGDA